MARFRQEKDRLLALFRSPHWQSAIESALTVQGIHGAADASRAMLNPLLSFLTRPEMRWQAAWGLGKALRLIAAENMEAARVLMRRLMWSLNEESGNLGWGIPEAMGCILAESPSLAKEYERILLSYIRNTGREDNYIDYAPLRRGAYWAVGRLATARPVSALPVLSDLVAGLVDADIPARLFAAFSCAQLAVALAGQPVASGEAALWQSAVQSLEAFTAHANVNIEILDGDILVIHSASELAAEARAAITQRMDPSRRSPNV